MKRTIITSLLAIIGLTAVGCTSPSSTQVESALSPLVSCEVNQLFNGGISDPKLLLTGCEGATATSLIGIATSLLASATTPTAVQYTESGAPILSEATAKLTPTQMAHLQLVQKNLQAYVADGGK
jgi:hypothetical protein